MASRTTITSLPDIDLDFRPRGYFWPLDLRTHVVSSIKGAERREYVSRMFEQSREDEIPGDIIQRALQPEDRQATGAIHPWFMGGEYLPDQRRHEVEIARITIASVTQDVTSVYARRTKHRIHYRVVDEYDGETLETRTARTSRLPLTVAELADFFLNAWDLLGVLDMNFEEKRYPPSDVMAFFWGSSEFYPDFGRLIALRVESWLQERRADLDEDADGDADEREFASAL
jgi:hypothetical protein